jgi:hypothetical protein
MNSTINPNLTTVQIDVTSLLNARPVTTLIGSRVVTWTEGLDGDWSGEATWSAARDMGTATPKAFPDDARFPATDQHPEVVLHFANTNTGPQVRRSLAEDSFTVVVPTANYERLDLHFMSANGSSKLKLTLNYADGSPDSKTVEIPDWFYPVELGDPLRYNLASDLGKWDKKNSMSEPDHHYLHGIALRPDPRRRLTGVSVEKPADGTLTFWGATGVVRKGSQP